MKKHTTYFCFLVVVSLSSCTISGTYKWVKFNTKLNPELLKRRDSVTSDPNLKYYDYEIYEMKFKNFGNLKYRFTKRKNEGGISFTQDSPLRNGKWELNNDTLSIHYTKEKADVPYLYLISRDSLIPLNNRTYWIKDK